MSRGKRNFFAAGWDDGADRADPRKARPAPTCQQTRKAKSARQSLGETPGSSEAAGAAAPSRRQRAFSLTQRGRESGEREGEKPPRQGREQKNGSTAPGSPRKNPRRAGAARPYGAFLGAREAPRKGPPTARRVKAAEHRNGGTGAHAEAQSQEGTTRKSGWGKDQARGAQPPQHPSQGQAAYLPPALQRP